MTTATGDTTATADAAERALQEEPYPVPSEAQFGEEDFLPADHLEAIAEALIDRHGLPAGDARRIVYLWRAKGGKSRGRTTWGKCQKPSGLLAYFADAEFVVWLAADHLRDALATRRQVEAAVYHELRHIDEETDEKTDETNLVCVDHDFAGFREELGLYGDVDVELRAVITQAQQLPLLDPVTP